MKSVSVQRILLLPGLDGTGRLFAPLQAALSESIEAVAIAYSDERRFEEYVETIAGRMSDTGNVLFAESFSGPIALALIHQFPSRIRCAILCATFAVSPFRTLCRAAGIVPTWGFRSGSLRHNLIRHFALNGEMHHAILPEILDVTDSVPAAVTRSRLELLSQLDMRPILTEIRQPVLYMQASRDRVVGQWLSRQLIEGLPEVDARIIAGPHMLAQTRPRECARAIEEFLLNSHVMQSLKHGG